MRYYPMFVRIENRHCLVVGAGEVGCRKIETLHKCGAGQVTVIDTRPAEGDLAELARTPGIVFEQRAFREEDLDGKFMVIASTSNEELNWRISNLCRERGILCNIVDQPEKCSFIVPALVTQGDLTLAISTGGQSPAMAKKIRKGLEQFFGAEYGRFLLVMGRLRPMVLEQGRETSANSGVFRAVVHSDLLESLAGPDFERAADILARHLPQALHHRIPELLHGLD